MAHSKKKSKATISHPGLKEILKSLQEISVAVIVRMDSADIPNMKRFLVAKTNFIESIMKILEKRS